MMAYVFNGNDTWWGPEFERLSGGAHYLLMVLGREVNSTGRTRTNSSILARAGRTNASSTKKYLKELKDNGFVSYDHRSGERLVEVQITWGGWAQEKQTPQPSEAVCAPAPVETIPEPTISEPPAQTATAQPQTPAPKPQRAPRMKSNLGLYKEMDWYEFWRAVGPNEFRFRYRKIEGLRKKQMDTLEGQYQPKDLEPRLVHRIASACTTANSPVSLIASMVTMHVDGTATYADDLLKQQPVKRVQTQSPGKPAEPLDIAPPAAASAMFENVRSLLRGP